MGNSALREGDETSCTWRGPCHWRRSADPFHLVVGVFNAFIATGTRSYSANYPRLFLVSFFDTVTLTRVQLAVLPQASNLMMRFSSLTGAIIECIRHSLTAHILLVSTLVTCRVLRAAKRPNDVFCVDCPTLHFRLAHILYKYKTTSNAACARSSHSIASATSSAQTCLTNTVIHPPLLNYSQCHSGPIPIKRELSGTRKPICTR
jgi:hypothetical protein